MSEYLEKNHPSCLKRVMMQKLKIRQTTILFFVRKTRQLKKKLQTNRKDSRT